MWAYYAWAKVAVEHRHARRLVRAQAAGEQECRQGRDANFGKLQASIPPQSLRNDMQMDLQFGPGAYGFRNAYSANATCYYCPWAFWDRVGLRVPTDGVGRSDETRQYYMRCTSTIKRHTTVDTRTNVRRPVVPGPAELTSSTPGHSIVSLEFSAYAWACNV